MISTTFCRSNSNGLQTLDIRTTPVTKHQLPFDNWYQVPQVIEVVYLNFTAIAASQITIRHSCTCIYRNYNSVHSDNNLNERERLSPQRTNNVPAAHTITTRRKTEYNITAITTNMTPQKYKITLDQLRMAAVCIVLLYSLYEQFSSNVPLLMFLNFSFFIHRYQLL